jgi:hypothetical protein
MKGEERSCRQQGTSGGVATTAGICELLSRDYLDNKWFDRRFEGYEAVGSTPSTMMMTPATGQKKPSNR